MTFWLALSAINATAAIVIAITKPKPRPLTDAFNTFGLGGQTTIRSNIQ